MNITIPIIAVVSAALVLAPTAACTRHAEAQPDPCPVFSQGQPVPESQQCLDSDYLEMVGEYGVVGNPTGTIAWGHRVCNEVSHGIPPLVVAQEILGNSPQLTQEQANAVVDASMMNYCGDFVSRHGPGILIQLHGPTHLPGG